MPSKPKKTPARRPAPKKKATSKRTSAKKKPTVREQAFHAAKKSKFRPKPEASVFARQASRVREYLNMLPDDPKASKGSLQDLSRQNEVPLKELRAFREGRDTALNRALVGAWSRILGTDSDIVTGKVSPIDREWYSDMLKTERTRIGRYDHYDQIEETRGEASQALWAWADITVTGSVGEGSRYNGAWKPSPTGRTNEALREVFKEADTIINTNLLPEQEKLLLIRDVSKLGDDFEQIGIEWENGKPSITKLHSMPCRTMWYNPKDDGTFDPATTFVQKKTESATEKPLATFPAWKIVHFANRESRQDPYGKSVFSHSLRKWVQIEAVEAGMLIRRLERAPMRYKHILDVGHLTSSEQIKEAREDAMRELERVPTVDGQGNFRNQIINMPVGRDFFVTKRDKESPADVAPMDGDGTIGELSDVMHFWRVWISGLGPPAAHLGYLDEVQRSVLSDLHIVWARKGRRMQMAFLKGLHHLTWVQLLLRDIDPRKTPYAIWPAPMNTRDEVMRAQIVVNYSNAVSNLSKAFATTGKCPTPQWYLQYVMGMDPDVIQDLELVDVIQQAAVETGNDKDKDAGPKGEEAKELASGLFQGSDAVKQQTLSGMKAVAFFTQEKAIELKKADHLSQENLEIIRPVNPFRDCYDDVARQIAAIRNAA